MEGAPVREEEKLQLLDEKLVKFLEELHGDSESSFADMPFIAHYTSLPALENIIQTKEFWFSNPLLMNDKHEVTHFLGLAKNSLIMLEISKSTRPHNLKNDQR
ncbi:MAG: hypothetical protein LW855_08695, partial [Alphaproteobacteria bacterium]|nr:hypothetical protein [Alphaproteobacteria bacterium]